MDGSHVGREEAWLEVDLKHLAQEDTVLVLDFTLALPLQHFLFVVHLHVRGLGRLLDVNYSFDGAQALDMK